MSTQSALVNRMPGLSPSCGGGVGEPNERTGIGIRTPFPLLKGSGIKQFRV